MVPNVLLPCLECALFILSYNEQAASGVHYAAVIGYILVQSLQLVSGGLLIYAIWSIRRYLKWIGDDGEEINIKALALHSSAFGLYMLSVVFNMSGFIVWKIGNTSVDE